MWRYLHTRFYIAKTCRKNFRLNCKKFLCDIGLGMTTKSQKISPRDYLSQMEPLLPGEHHLQPLLEQAHDLQRAA